MNPALADLVGRAKTAGRITGAGAQMEADAAAAAPITDEEADWLMKRLGGAPLSAAGHALIERLKAQAAGAAGKLKPLFDAA